MRKMTMLVSGGIGYVLGARAGRERYEQIRQTAMKIKGNPTVQATATKAAETAKEAAPVVKEKVAGAADSATDKAHSSGSSSDPGTAGTNSASFGGTAYPSS